MSDYVWQPKFQEARWSVIIREDQGGFTVELQVQYIRVLTKIPISKVFLQVLWSRHRNFSLQVQEKSRRCLNQGPAGSLAENEKYHANVPQAHSVGTNR